MKPTSMLQQFAANYGSTLRSMLGGGNVIGNQPPQPTMQDYSSGDDGSADGMPEVPAPYQAQGSAMDQDQAPQDAGGEQPGSAMQGKPGYTFRQAFKDAPANVQEQQLNKLQQSLKQGNQTIDSAYDDLVKQLGTPPDPNRKLSQKEKGMLLMEFGLSMLSNSRKGFAGAAGDAGTQTMGSYLQMKQGPSLRYQQDREAIEGARAKDKATLARTSALESVKTPAGTSRLPGRFTGKDGKVYFYDEGGQTQQAKDDKGQPILADEHSQSNPRFESDAKYEKYMDIYGKDENGQPLTGLALERVKRDALDFSTSKADLSDLDLDINSEKSADNFMNAHPDLFEGMTADEANAYRDRLADRRRSRLHRPVRSRLESKGEPTRGGGTGPKKRFNSEADAKAAFDRGDIKIGDSIIVNGVEGPVE